MVNLIEDVGWWLGTEGMAGSGKGGDGELLLGPAELVDDDDVDLFKVLNESMKVVYLESTASVVATLGGCGWVRDGVCGETHQLVLAVKGGEGVEDGAAIALEGGGELCALEVAGAAGGEEEEEGEGVRRGEEGARDTHSSGPRS